MLLLYLNDIIVINPDFDTHLQWLEEAFQHLKEARLQLKLSKCELLQSQVRYLDHVISSEDVSADQEKTQVVQDWSTPRRLMELQGFFGYGRLLLVGYT